MPDNTHRTPSYAISDGDSTSLGKAIKPQLEQHPGHSGVHLLGSGRDAFVARAVNARLAERTIDVQYYMFHQDTVGRLLIIHDSAEKQDRDRAWRDHLLMSQLAPYIRAATQEFILVSPYFVPGQAGADALCELTRKGVNVRILTNSLVSNDVAAVHATYMRHRKQLVRSGVQLYELNEQIKKEERKLFSWLPGLSKSSLHAKTMTIDREIMFVGSFNFDQRSLFINNEIGLLLHDSEVAGHAAKVFDAHVDKVAFRVELVRDKGGPESLRWTGTEEGKQVVFHSEPYAGFWKKLTTNLMRVLPIDSMM